MNEMLVIILFSHVYSLSAHLTLQIDNGVVGEPEVQCGSDSISLVFNSRNPFAGKVFVKIFITRVDRAYRLSCFYVEGTKKVQQQLDVAALTTQVVESQTQLPVCRYDILSEGPNGVPIKYGKIGDTIYHKWTCVSEVTDVYCMRVHSCTVYDGQGGPPVTVLDTNGCTVDGVILQNLDYTDDMTAGKSAQVFKFADKAGLYFNCQIQLTIKDKQFGCTNAVPQCGQTYVQSSPQTTESADYTQPQEPGYPTQPAAESTQGSATTQPPGYNGERYPQPAPFEVRPEYAKLDVAASSESHVPGAPGIRPTYNDLHPNETLKASSPGYTEQSAYTRLIKRNIKAAPQHNRSQPIAVADFDLPERGLIVFGLEDSNGDDQDETESPSHLVLQDRSVKTCFATNKVLLFTVMTVALFVALICAMSLVVYKQRRLISQPAYLKH